jgi:hypothetical protein
MIVKTRSSASTAYACVLTAFSEHHSLRDRGRGLRPRAAGKSALGGDARPTGSTSPCNRKENNSANTKAYRYHR